MHRQLTISAATLFIVLSATTLSCGKGPRYTDPNKADADFGIQGEYTGQLQTDDGKLKVGVQVIALGQGEFRAVGYTGGLPGDGWDKEKPERVESELQDGRVAFACAHGTGTIQNGVLSVTNDEGQTIGTLERVIRKSPTLQQEPPAEATTLFDGSDAKQWKNGRLTKAGLLMEGTTSNPTFQSHQLHIEFCLPYQPEDRGQGRGNSGVYVQGRYEVQMLDSFGLEGKHNECGGIYSISDPDVNMCYPPLSWQTYDIDFTAARFDENGTLVAQPRMTLRHNGVPIHQDVELPKSTTAARLRPGPEPGPVYLQNHGCPVRYRNIWVVPQE